MAGETSGDGPGIARVGKLRISKKLRRGKRGKKSSRRGLPESAWRATGISKASQAGHSGAGPIMQYGDDT
jgi:hypothetical protein